MSGDRLLVAFSKNTTFSKPKDFSEDLKKKFRKYAVLRESDRLWSNLMQTFAYNEEQTNFHMPRKCPIIFIPTPLLFKRK